MMFEKDNADLIAMDTVPLNRVGSFTLEDSDNDEIGDEIICNSANSEHMGFHNNSISRTFSVDDIGFTKKQVRANVFLDKKALIVDDSPHTRKMLAQFIERIGFDSIEVGDGEEAVAMIEKMMKEIIYNESSDISLSHSNEISLLNSNSAEVKSSSSLSYGLYFDEDDGSKMDVSMSPHRGDMSIAAFSRTTTEIKQFSSLSEFDLILMDGIMQKMNGPEATRRIRDLGYGGIIIGVTGNFITEAEIDRFMNNGADAVLNKVLDLAEFTRIYEEETKQPFLMGNAVTKKFDVPKEHKATAGYDLNWKIWDAVNKETGETVSLWGFDKNELFKRKVNPITDKTVLEQIFQFMKKDLTMIKDCKGSGNIIQYTEVIEESKSTLVFTTEKVVCSLVDLLNKFQSISGAQNVHSDFFEEGETLSEMEISRGFLSLAEGLQYLHTVQRKLHLGITPESVLITASGTWKWCGFGFSLSFVQGDLQRIASPYFLKANTSTFARLEPDLRYCGPELTEGGYNPSNIRYLLPTTDSFSLSLLVYEMYKYALLTLPSHGSHQTTIHISNNEVQQHIYALESLKFIDTSFLPPGLIGLITGLFQPNAVIRLTPTDIINNPYFSSGSQSLLTMVDNLSARDVGTQSSQIISLQTQLAHFPPRVLSLSVLPTVSQLSLASPALWVYTLPLHVNLAKQIKTEKYVKIASPYIAQGLAITNPTESMQAFLHHMTFIAETFDKSFFQKHCAHIFYNAMEKQNIYLQNLAMEKLTVDSVVSKFDNASLIEKLVPKLCKEACKNLDVNVKLQCLYVLSLLCKKLEKDYIAANILPSLKYIMENDKSSSISMCVIGSYEALSEYLSAEYVATYILPSFQPMLMDKSLDKQQFEVVLDLVGVMLKKIVDTRTSDLGIPPITVNINTDKPSRQKVDPFAAAKLLIESSRKLTHASNSLQQSAFGVNASGPTRSGSISGNLNTGAPSPPTSAPPPPPSLPPPPPPSMNELGLRGSSIDAASSSYQSKPLNSFASPPMNTLQSPPLNAFPSSGGLPFSQPLYGEKNFNSTVNSNLQAPVQIPSLSGFNLNNDTKTESTVAPSSPKKVTSSRSWFGSSKPAVEPAASEVYTPPVIPISSAYIPPSTGATSMNTKPMQDDDMTDFLNSFGKTSTAKNNQNSFSQPSSFPMVTQNTASNLQPTYGNVQQSQSQFGISQSNVSFPMNGSSGALPTNSSSGNFYGNNNMNNTLGQLPSYSSNTMYPQNVPQNSNVQSFQSNTSYGTGVPPYGASYGAGVPSYSTGVSSYGTYAVQQNPGLTYGNPQMNTNNFQYSNNIGNLPVNNGYQPPLMPTFNQQPPANGNYNPATASQGKKGSSVSNAFDFLN